MCDRWGGFLTGWQAKRGDDGFNVASDCSNTQNRDGTHKHYDNKCDKKLNCSNFDLYTFHFLPPNTVLQLSVYPFIQLMSTKTALN